MEKQEIRNKAWFKNKNEAEVKKYRGNIRKVHKKIIFRGYGDEGKS